MSYTITLTNGSTLATLEPQEVDTTHSSLTLFGQGTGNYGAYYNDNLVRHLENFANTVAPTSPLTGQLWYDSSYKVFRVWSGTAWVALRPDVAPNNAGIATAIIGSSPSIAAFISNGKILAALCDRTVVNSSLPATITYRDTPYSFAIRFPDGIGPGLTISSDMELSPSDNSDTLVTSKWVRLQSVFATIANNTFLGNFTGSTALPTATSLTTALDSLGNNRGSVLYRGISSWAALSGGTNGQVFQTRGPGADPQWANSVLTFNTRSGAVTLTSGDVTAALGFTPAGTTITNNTLMANISGGVASPSETTISALLDSTLSNTQGSMLYRGSSSWSVLAPGIKGQLLQTSGSGSNPAWSNGPIIQNNLRLKGNAAGGTKTATWTASEVIAHTTLSGISFKGTALSFSFNGATTGVGGIDIGTMPVSANFAIYAIYNPTSNTWGTLGYASGSAIASTVYSGSNMPSGYIASCLIWVGVTDGSSNIQQFAQNQRKIYVNSVQVLNAVAGSSNTYYTLSLSSILPPDAREVYGFAGGTSTSTATELALASDTSGSFVTYVHIGGSGGTTLDGIAGSIPFGQIPLTTAQQIAWKSANTTQTNVINIRGYEF